MPIYIKNIFFYHEAHEAHEAHEVHEVHEGKNYKIMKNFVFFVNFMVKINLIIINRNSGYYKFIN